MKSLITILFLFFVFTNLFAQQDEVVGPKHEFIANLGISMDLDKQYIAGFDYYYNLNDVHQIGSGLAINLFNVPFNVTNRTFQEAYFLNDLSYFEELQPLLAYYLDVPFVYAHKFQLRNASFKIEGGVTNKFLLGVNGHVNRVYQTQTSVTVRNFDHYYNISRWIVPHGFKKFALNSSTSISYFLKTGMGFKIQVGFPILKMSEAVANIPSGETLFEDDSQPMTLMVHFLCKLNKKQKSR